MPISIFPVPVTSSINANSITAASPNVLYQGVVALDPAIYQITCAATTIARVEFFSDNVTLITTAITASGTVTVNLATAATRFRVWTNTGSNIVVTVTKIAAALTDNAPSGTLDTITSTGTYTGTSASGYGYAVLVGGGGGGGGSNGGSSSAGGGGGGGVAEKLVQLTGSMAVTIGNGGAAGAGGGAGAGRDGSAGGTSTFAGMTANGGGGGITNFGGGGAGGTASGGTYNTSGTAGTADSGSGGAPGSGGSPQTVYKFVIETPGTGRQGGGFNTGGFPGTGRGAGGCGSSHSNGPGGAGTAGALYVLRY